MADIGNHNLYLVISEEYGAGRPAEEIAFRAIAGGVDIIQMREKHKSRIELVELGRRLSRLCREHGVTFIVNDDPLLAKETGADGVHLGQEDMRAYGISAARAVIGPDRMIGISTHSLAEVSAANGMDIDYMAYGPVFPTKTKKYHLGTGEVKKILETALKPVVFIGGIGLLNLDELLDLGAGNIAVIRAIAQAEDITAAARELKARIGAKAGGNG